MYDYDGHNNHHQMTTHCPYVNHQLDELDPPPSHERITGSRSGIWIYVCFQCMDSFIDHNHNHQHPPRAPTSCEADCCRSKLPTQHVSDHHKKPEKYATDDKPTVRVYCKAKTDYSLTIRDGNVILAPSNPYDPHQHWVKDEKFGINVKDEQGFSSFAFVNKATGQALKHSIGVKYPVQLIDYNPDKVDKSILWSMGKNEGNGYRAIRAVDNIHLNVDGFEGIKELGGVRDGTKIVLWEWVKGNNQMWTIISY